MIITPVQTSSITAEACTIETLIDKYIPNLKENSILVITSKIVSLCEGAVRPQNEVSKSDLIWQQAQYVLAVDSAPHDVIFTISHNMLIPSAGIDESNGNDMYVLWPQNPQKSANDLRAYLIKKFTLMNVGVIITDSTSSPLRRGTSGIYIAHSGFQALNSYVGKPDVFGEQLKSNVANVANGLAASAVVTMGEGAERTPLAIIENVPFVSFQDRDPSRVELEEQTIRPEDDIFAPFLSSVEWKKGETTKY